MLRKVDQSLNNFAAKVKYLPGRNLDPTTCPDEKMIELLFWLGKHVFKEMLKAADNKKDWNIYFIVRYVAM